MIVKEYILIGIAIIASIFIAYTILNIIIIGMLLGIVSGNSDNLSNKEKIILKRKKYEEYINNNND